MKAWSQQRRRSIKRFCCHSIIDRPDFWDSLPLTRVIVVLLLLLITTISWAKETPADLTELSLEDLMKIEIPFVYGASRYEQKVTEAPSSVSIVTAAEIKKYGYRTLADILRSLRGFFITFDRNYSYAGVRGFNRPGDYNTRILLLVDGHRVNDNIYDGALIGMEFILDVDLIDRVEVIRGPSSSIYGSNAFFGVINVITRRGRDLKGGEISGGIASFETYKGRLKVHHPKLKVLYMSGYTDNAIVHHGVLWKGTHYIQKPFTVDGLARKIREVLDK